MIPHTREISMRVVRLYLTQVRGSSKLFPLGGLSPAFRDFVRGCMGALGRRVPYRYSEISIWGVDGTGLWLPNMYETNPDQVVLYPCDLAGVPVVYNLSRLNAQERIITSEQVYYLTHTWRPRR